MKLKLLYNRESPKKNRWVIWERNIGQRFLGKLVWFKEIENTINGPIHYFSLTAKGVVEKLMYDSHEKDGDTERFWKGNSTKQPTDTYRNLTMQEYNAISALLKMANMRYNKKKDEFIENKHEIETII
jgi:hypothetical protein